MKVYTVEAVFSLRIGPGGRDHSSSGAARVRFRPEARSKFNVVVHSSMPLECLPCYMPGALGVGVVFDFSHAFQATGNNCVVASRHEIACSLGRVATQVPLRP